MSTGTVLSPSQAVAEQKFVDFMMDDQAKELVISGFAGSGKSYLVRYLARTLENIMKMGRVIGINDEKPAHFTATTNKAAQVLSNMLYQPAQTIHSLLGLKVKNDYKTGKTSLSPTDRTQVITNQVIFIDEASMIDQELLAWLRKCAGSGTKLVFIGDPYQLPPVMEPQGSLVFKKRHAKRNIELTEIQRQLKGNPIIELGARFREMLDNPQLNEWPDMLADDQHIFRIDGSDFQQLVRERFIERDNQPDEARILAWSNKKVVEYNKFVRAGQGRDPECYEEKEWVVTNNPIFRNRQIVYGIDKNLQVEATQPWTDSETDIEGFMVGFFGSAVSAFVPKDWHEARAAAKHYAKHKDWPMYFYIQETFADLRPIHAQTVHKSQGSTYQEVFIDVSDIGTNTKWYEIARLMYVATSRASQRVYLYGDLPKRRIER